jgi:hypothetical protein
VLVRTEVSRARNEVEELRGMHVHPSVSTLIHHQNHGTSARKLYAQYLRCKLSHLRVRFHRKCAHLEREYGLEGWRGGGLR